MTQSLNKIIATKNTIYVDGFVYKLRNENEVV